MKEAIIVNAQSAPLATADPQQTTESTKGMNVVASNSLNHDSWNPFASFVVEFQTHTIEGRDQEQRTKVHHIETDTCAAWPGIEKVYLCQWMIAHLPIDLP